MIDGVHSILILMESGSFRSCSSGYAPYTANYTSFNSETLPLQTTQTTQALTVRPGVPSYGRHQMSPVSDPAITCDASKAFLRDGWSSTAPEKPVQLEENIKTLKQQHTSHTPGHFEIGTKLHNTELEFALFCTKQNHYEKDESRKTITHYPTLTLVNISKYHASLKRVLILQLQLCVPLLSRINVREIQSQMINYNTLTDDLLICVFMADFPFICAVLYLSVLFLMF